MFRPITACAFLLLTTFAMTLPQVAQGEDSPKNVDAKPDSEAVALQKSFQETMSGAKLIGSFTIIGKEPGKLNEEAYTISSVEKLEEGDYWLFKARIKYGKHDVEIPMPLEVKWAGDTPIITLTKTKIPTLGTFSARVIIYNGKYAGTWTHDEVGGHLFGRVESAAKKTAEP